MKRYKYPALVLFSLILLGTMALGANASSNGKQTSSANPVASPGKAISIASAKPYVVNMQNVPKETASQAAANGTRKAMPLGTGVNSSVYAQRKSNAAHNQNAVKPTTAPLSAPAKSGSSATKTPGLINNFQGMSDSAQTCPYFGGCQPSDMGLAVSFQQVVQAVNTSVAVYNLNGTLFSGWPKNAQNFFGISNPGSCSPTGPFLSDPRAFYDQNFNRFWVEMVQIEGAVDSCPQSSTLWIAVSKTGDASKSWNIYAFNFGAIIADYPEFGFDQTAIYFSFNVFSFSTGGFVDAAYFGANKFAMMSGSGVTAFGFSDPTLNGLALDTVQPTLGEALQVGGPLSGHFIASEDINFGGGECSASVCSGVVIITMSNPGTSSVSASAAFINTDGYSLPPGADEPGCAGCMETLDTRISGTPVWHNGVITFSLDTAVNNGSQIVSGIFWGQIAVYLNDNGSIQSLALVQDGYHFYGGDSSAYFGAQASDSDGDLVMVFAFSDSGTFPEVAYTSRRVTVIPGLFHDGGLILKAGAASYLGGRWGDYFAVSPSGVPFTDDIWFAGQWSTAAGDWSTWIGHTKFVKNQN